MLAWRSRGPRSLRRQFVTPEGVDLQLELGSLGARAGAFAIDMLVMMLTLIALTIALAFAFSGSGKQGIEILGILWLVGAFVLRNGWFIMFEMGGRGATPGKRIMGLRVVARDGERLTGSAVIARNAMRELEVYLPLSFLGAQAAQDLANGFLLLFALIWCGVFVFFPCFNRDRLRVGDLIAGTWVVRTVLASLGSDLAASGPARYQFSEAALNLYGVYELQTLADVLRADRPGDLALVASQISAKMATDPPVDPRPFLEDYYAALCARLERAMLLGRRRATKFDLERALP